MQRIFISYSSKDRTLVDELAGDIELLLDDCTIWYDRELSRSGGQQWWNLICKEIRACDVFINALSPHVLKSEPCRREYAYACALGKPVLPVILADVEIRHLPLELQEAQLVNFRERSREQQRSLKASLRNMPPAPPPPPNAVELAPPAPLDPVGVLFDRIQRLPIDNDEQRLVLLAIEDLHEEEIYQRFVPDLLARLLDRDDVLTARNHRRADELRVRITSVVTAVPRIEFPPAAPPKPAEPTAGTRMTDDKGVDMVYVPAGTFMMGSDNGGDDEKPVHEVQIKHPFWLDLTPVTNQAFERFVKDGGYKNQSWWTKDGWKWLQKEKVTEPEDDEGFTDPQQPRVGMSWYEAVAYSAWRGGRLPTEAEWEWAARGPENRIYPWGDTFDANRIIFNGNSGGKTAVVGAGIRQSGASWVSALDMSGSVWEWCSSLYKPYPYRASDGRENLESEGFRVRRGGSWYGDLDFARSVCRLNSLPNYRHGNLGFRVLRPPSL